MGIYLMINIEATCDHCGTFVCIIQIAKRDLPVYQNSVVTCAACKEKGIKHPSGSTDKHEDCI